MNIIVIVAFIVAFICVIAAIAYCVSINKQWSEFYSKLISDWTNVCDSQREDMIELINAQRKDMIELMSKQRADFINNSITEEAE